MNQSVAEISLVAQLIKVDLHQLAPGDHQHCGRKTCVAEERQRQGCTDAPENQNVEGKGQQGIEHTKGELEALGRERAGVISDALVWIINIRRLFIVRIEDVVGAVAHVVPNQAARQPITPDNPELQGEEDLRHTDRQRHHKAAGVNDQDPVEAIFLFGHQGIGEVSRDEADAGIDAIDRQQHQHDHAEHQPMQPAAVAQLLAHRQERRSSHQEQTAEDHTPGAAPDAGDRAGHPAEILLGDLGQELFKQSNQAGESHQHQTADAEQQRHQQPTELPAVGLIEGQKEGLGQVAQLVELAAQTLARRRGGNRHGCIVARLTSTGRPIQGSTADHVHMQVEHGLPRGGATVDHSAEILQTLLPRNPGRHQQQMPQQLFIAATSAAQAFNRLPGDHQHMHGGLGSDVAKGQAAIVAVNLIAGDVPPEDLSKDRVVRHGEKIRRGLLM